MDISPRYPEEEKGTPDDEKENVGDREPEFEIGLVECSDRVHLLSRYFLGLRDPLQIQLAYDFRG